MNVKWKSSGLVGIGIVAGIFLGLNFSAVAQRETRNPLPLPEIQTLAEVFGNIKQGYVEPVEDKKLLTGAVKGMLTELDPHSAYLDPEENKEFETSIRGEFGGLGIEVGTEEGYVKVVSPIEDTPAARAGIKSGDLIVKIDDTSTKGISLSDAVKKMRGKPKTPIKLTVARKGENRPLEFTLMREVIRVQSVKAKLIEPGFAHIRITQFQERTVDDLARALDRMYKESNGKLTGLVLDMRNNPGGLLHSAIGVSAAFLDSRKLVVSSNGRLPDTKHEYLASPEEYSFRTREDALRGLPAALKTVPIVVLVNDGSASASEIVAGALQDYGRGIVIGDSSTHGKGSVQQVVEMKQLSRALALSPQQKTGAAKFTIQKYYLPSGASTQLKGVVPDITLPSIEDFIPMIGESDLPRALVWDRIPSSKFDGAPLDPKVVTPLRQASLDRQAKLEEFVYLRKIVDSFKTRQEQKLISVNLEERRAQKVSDDAFRKEMKAEKDRLAKNDYAFKPIYLGPPPVPKIKAPKKGGDDDDDLEDFEENETYVKMDVHLRETLRVLNDAIILGRNRDLWASNHAPLTVKGG